MCKHNICAQLWTLLNSSEIPEINSNKTKKGVACVIYDTNTEKIILGRENYGRYQGKLSLCAGGLESQDDNCFIGALKRELFEEFKLNFDWKNFNKCFKSHGVFNIVIHHGTPVFRGKYPIDINELNKINKQYVNSNNPALREMSELVLVDPNNLPNDVSSFVKAVLKY